MSVARTAVDHLGECFLRADVDAVLAAFAQSGPVVYAGSERGEVAVGRSALRTLLGACGNEYAPADGRVVGIDYGCGAHSQATLAPAEPAEVVTSARYDTADFDVLTD